MYGLPSAGEIARIAESFGIHLDEVDAAAYRDVVVAQLATYDEFLQTADADEDRPPLRHPARAPGHRPGPAEDPYRAWRWRCRIGGGDGPLAGRTVAFKDHIAVAGIPLAFGSAVLDGFVADVDATVVTRSLDAGAIVTGKTTHHGFSGVRGLGGRTGDHPEPVNPHAPDRLAGGSSSGAAVAVAAGEVDIAFGGDQGGSVRQPAAYCGVIGLKPTFGLVPHTAATYAGEPTLDHIGPLARTVADVAAALDAVAGWDGYDPRQGRDIPDRVDTVAQLGRGARGLRIGVLEEGFAEPIEDEVRDLVLAAVDTLAAAGAEVRKVSVPTHAAAAEAAGILQLDGYRAARAGGPFGSGARTWYPVTITAALERLWRHHGDQLATYLKLACVVGELSNRNFAGAVYAKAHNARGRHSRAYDAALADLDVLVMPTCPDVAPPRPEPLDPLAAARAELDVLAGALPAFRNLQPFNYTGHPALALPVGKTAAGLPVSMQIVGRHLDDARVLSVAAAFEAAVDLPAIVAVGGSPP